MFANDTIEYNDFGNQGAYCLSENISDDMESVVCCYFGRKTKVDKTQSQPYNMRPKKEEGAENQNVRVLSIDKCIADPSELETFKLLTQMDYQQLFAEVNLICAFFFTCEKESAGRKSPFLKFFNQKEVFDLKSFRRLGLPLKQVVKIGQPTDHLYSQDWSQFRNMKNIEVFETDLEQTLDTIIDEGQHGCVCEIDISDPPKILRLIQAQMKLSPHKNLYSEMLADSVQKQSTDVCPLLFVWNGAGASIIPWWTIRFKQAVCTRFLIAKLMKFKYL